MPTANVREYLWIKGEASSIDFKEYPLLEKALQEDDPFAACKSFVSQVEAKNLKDKLEEKYAKEGGYLTGIYSKEKPKRMKSLSDEEWEKVELFDDWPGQIPENEVFRKAYRYDGIKNKKSEDNEEEPTHSAYVLITIDKF
jgi:hypothetical protein